VEKFYKPLFEESPIIKAQFMFKMLDFDEDGYLHASDLVEA
jgi:Ca2+-binding EF-hand superfamily protein